MRYFSLPYLFKMYIKHWFEKVDNKYEHKPRFTPCQGCKEDLKLWKKLRKGK